MTRSAIIAEARIRAGRKAQTISLDNAFDDILKKMTTDYPLLRNICHPFTTVASQAWVALPSDYRSYEQCFYDDDELIWMEPEEYFNWIRSETDTASTPSRFTIVKDESRLYLWPKPNAATAGYLYYAAIHPKMEKTVPFTSGGTYEIKRGDTITGHTSSKTMVVNFIRLTGGSWAGGDAAGTMLGTPSGTMQSENLDVGANLNVATIAADATTVDNSPHFIGEDFDEAIIEGVAWKALELIEDDLRAAKKETLFLNILKDKAAVKLARKRVRTPYRGY